jgi:hypothetical protein
VVRKRNICLIVAQINHQAIVTIEQKDLRDLDHNPRNSRLRLFVERGVESERETSAFEK